VSIIDWSYVPGVPLEFDLALSLDRLRASELRDDKGHATCCECLLLYAQPRRKREDSKGRSQWMRSMRIGHFLSNPRLSRIGAV
jgi:hypothetical protein